MLRKIYRFIDGYISDNVYLQAITFVVLWAVFSCISMFGIFDITPATTNDYAPLIAQQEKIKNDFDIVYSYNNYTISPKEDNVKVILSSEQCSLACSFDKNLKFIDSKKIDKANSKIEALLGSIFLGFMFGGGLAVILTLILPWVLSIILKLFEKICRLLI